MSDKVYVGIYDNASLKRLFKGAKAGVTGVILPLGWLEDDAPVELYPTDVWFAPQGVSIGDDFVANKDTADADYIPFGMKLYINTFCQSSTNPGLLDVAEKKSELKFYTNGSELIVIETIDKRQICRYTIKQVVEKPEPEPAFELMGVTVLATNEHNEDQETVYANGERV